MAGSHRMGVPRGKALQDLMTGLIYPAVLGTIMFSVFEAAEDGFRSLSTGNIVFSPVLAVKWALILVTILFYGCDYLYATHTRCYGRLFFFLDFLFLVFLYATVQVIGIKKAQVQPNGFWIAVLYLLFMILYYFGDRREWRACHTFPDRCMPGELDFYNRVLGWEKQSIVYLSFSAGLLYFRPDRRFLWFLVLVLAVITWFFRLYAWEKKEFYAVREEQDKRPNRCQPIPESPKEP